MKKLLIVFGTLFVLAIAAIIVIPLVVDVDQYRPQIVKTANEKLNGKLELGHLDLSLWGTIRVGIEGLQLVDAKGTKVVAVKDAHVRIPWTSIFGGSPLFTFSMTNPELRVIKDASGKLNVMTLMKEQPKTAGDATAEAAPAAGEGTAQPGAEKAKIPAIVANARFGLDIEDALLYYADEATRSETVTKNLDLRVKDLSLSRKTEIELSGLFESKAEDVFKIAGPFQIRIDADPRVEGGEFKGLAATFDGNFDDLEIQAGQAFHKKKGMTAQFQGSMDVTKDSATISKMQAKFFNAVLEATGKVIALQAEPVLDFKMKSNAISLEPWNELVPMLKDYSLTGTASFDAAANGPTAKLQYGADIAVKDLKAKAPMLKAEPVMNAIVKIATDKIEKMNVTVKAPGNDLTVDGTMVSFTKPKVDLRIASTSLNLDQLLDLPPPKKGDAKAAPAGGGGGRGSAGGGKPAAGDDLDAKLDPLRKNEMARETTLAATANLKLIQFHGVKVTDLVAKLSMRNLVASIDSMTMKVWDGTIGMKASTNMKPKTPTYDFSTTVSGLDLRRAVESQLEMFKNTLLGKVNFQMKGTGASYNPETAKRSLKAGGSMRVVDGTFQSIDIGKVVGEAVNKALEKVGDKIPGAKGKTIRVPEKTSKYEYIASDFTISGGRFVAPNFTAKAVKNDGFDLKGSTEVGLIDQELKADWQIIDTYNLTKARDIGFTVSGVQVPSALSEGGNPVVIPISVGCKYTAPCPSYVKVPEHFVKVALGNVKKGAVQEAKTQVTEKAKEAGKKLLKGLFK